MARGVLMARGMENTNRLPGLIQRPLCALAFELDAHVHLIKTLKPRGHSESIRSVHTSTLTIVKCAGRSEMSPTVALRERYLERILVPLGDMRAVLNCLANKDVARDWCVTVSRCLEEIEDFVNREIAELNRAVIVTEPDVKPAEAQIESPAPLSATPSATPATPATPHHTAQLSRLAESTRRGSRPSRTARSSAERRSPAS
jgi:hypothetical protein